MRAILTALTAIALTALAPGAAAEPENLVCFEYNPGALTNACVTVDHDRPLLVDVPNADGPDVPVCVIGPVCVYVPGIGWTETPVPKPYFDGYVEATAVCWVLGDGLCRVDLPHVQSSHPWPL